MDISKIVSLPDLQKLASTKQLKEADLEADLFPNGKIEQPFPLPLENVTFLLKASADFTVRLFNSDKTIDKDEVIGISANSLIRTDNQLYDKNALLKYTVACGIKANTAASLPNLGFNVDANQDITFNLYKKHENSETVFSSVKNDLAGFAFLFNKTELLDTLKPGEAALMRISGGINTQMKIKWSDIFTFGIGPLLKSLNIVKPVQINFDASGSSTFKVSFTDDFNLIIYKNTDKDFILKLKKSTSDKFSNSTGIGVQASFSNQKDILALYNKLIKNLTGQEPSVITEYAQKAQLDDKDKAQVIIILNKVGIENADAIVNPLAKLIEFIAGLQKNIEEIASLKVKAGFSFDYNRLKSNDSILEIGLTKEVLDQYHSDLIKFNTSNIIENISKPESNIKLISYLNEEKLERNASWGFGISFGKWLNIFGKDNKHEETIIEKDINGKIKKVSYVGSRNYASKLGDTDNWGGTFKAQMNKTSAGVNPTMSEFDLGLHLFLEQTDKKPTNESISTFVDNAVLWGIINQTDSLLIIDIIREIISKSPEISYSVQLLTDNKTTRELIPYFSQRNNNILANAFAASMDYVDTFNLRKTVETRRNFYAKYWSAFLNKKAQIGDLVLALYDELEKNSDADVLPTTEKEGNFDYTFKKCANSNVENNLTVFIEGMQNLKLSLLNNSEYNSDIFHKPFQNFKELWTQSFTVRAFGYYLLDIVKMQNLSSQGISKSFTVKYKIDGNENVLTFCSKTN